MLNIGGGRAVPARELVSGLARRAGFRGRLEERAAGSARSARVSWQCSDITAAHRDFVDVRDLVRAVALAVTAHGPLPPVLNIGGGRAVPARELVSGLARRAGFRGRLEGRAAGSARSARVSWQCSDITAADRALGRRPVHGLDDALDALWAATAGSGRVP
ncbi:hypothetical protein Scel_02190 [Streptomyces cellostaticus]|nr:hypothetical protein Scel_02190 [Streptomyces cellostaticus]